MTKQTWVLVADGGRARLLATPRILADGRFVQLAAYSNSEALEAPPSTDRPGRSFESANTMRHAVAEYSDTKKQPKLEFADRLAEVINKGAAGDEFARLYIVAAPVLMGRVRAGRSPAASGPIGRTPDKDLTPGGAADLPRHLADMKA